MEITLPRKQREQSTTKGTEYGKSLVRTIPSKSKKTVQNTKKEFGYDTIFKKTLTLGDNIGKRQTD